MYFLCPFDQVFEEYGDTYDVYRLAHSTPIPDDGESWIGLERGGVRVGRIPVAEVRFDPTTRSGVHASDIAMFL